VHQNYFLESDRDQTDRGESKHCMHVLHGDGDTNTNQPSY